MSETHCGGCGGSGGCGGCARELVLTGQELAFLKQLGQIPFLPVARTREDPAPIYPEGGAQATAVLQCLEKKGLISLDFDKPIRGFSSPEYGIYPIVGSMALTQRGQQVLELLEYQGCNGEES